MSGRRPDPAAVRCGPHDTRAHIAGVREFVYAAVGEGSCPACKRWDGAVLARDDRRVCIPNPHCTCPDGCRCHWIPIVEGEQCPAVGPRP